MKKRCGCLAVGEVEHREAHMAGFGELGAAGFLQRRIVVGIHVVDADNVPSFAQQPPGNMESDKSGGTGDENGPISHRHRACV